MYPPTHFIAGLVAGEIGASLGYLDHRQALVVGLLALLVDLDHYLYYYVKYKTLSFYKAWEAAVIKKEKGERTTIHHYQGFIFFSIVILLLFFIDHQWAIILGSAYYSHMILDYTPLGKKRLRFKLLGLDFKLSYLEMILDAGFIGVILVLMYFIFYFQQ